MAEMSSFSLQALYRIQKHNSTTHTHTFNTDTALLWNDDSDRLYLDTIVRAPGLIAEMRETIGNDTTYTTIQNESD